MFLIWFIIRQLAQLRFKIVKFVSIFGYSLVIVWHHLLKGGKRWQKVADLEKVHIN
jgi:hypothetical protein